MQLLKTCDRPDSAKRQPTQTTRGSDFSWRGISVAAANVLRFKPVQLVAIALVLGGHGSFCADGCFAQETPNSPPARGTMRLADQLLQTPPADLLLEVRTQGDARRGGLIFHRGEVGCAKCHVPQDDAAAIGPVLYEASSKAPPLELIESILEPSARIKEGYETWLIVTDAGEVLSGQLAEDPADSDQLLLRPLQDSERVVELDRSSIEEKVRGEQSLMPVGLVNALNSRQEFLDLARYVIEIAEGGSSRAEQLQPPAFLLAEPPLPAYESQLDHAGFINDWDDQAFARGEAIYQRSCVNCHGTVEEPGSLPTSLRFAEGRFKKGGDPYSMYRTLTHGYGLMVAQRWMVPQQKYDVIHYIREAYLAPHNPDQLTPLSDDYLASLPTGDSRGPAPSNEEPWVAMNYGPTMSGTFEFGSDGGNFAYKGIAVRLDPGPGGVSQGSRWLIFDHDTMRVAGVWTGEGFIDWNGIHFNGRHGIHPRVVGDVVMENPIGPGWGRPTDGSFEDPRLRGRDDKPYGPLPREWTQYRGLYHFGNRAVFSYTVGKTAVLEMPRWEQAESTDVVSRVFEIGPRERDLILQVVDARDASWSLRPLNSAEDAADTNESRLFDSRLTASAVHFGPQAGPRDDADQLSFEGTTWVDIPQGDAFDMTDRDFTIVAHLQTTKGGTIFAKTRPTGTWVPQGKTFFVREGRLVYDIGWVGAVTSDAVVADGKPHMVAVTYAADAGRVTLYVDGERAGSKQLQPEETVRDHHARIGYTSTNFPGEPSCFIGKLTSVRFDQRLWTPDELQAYATAGTLPKVPDAERRGTWKLDEPLVTTDPETQQIADQSGADLTGLVRVDASAPTRRPPLLLGVSEGIEGHTWTVTPDGQVRLRIPAGERPLRFRLAMAPLDSKTESPTSQQAFLANISEQDQAVDLSSLTQGGPPRWPTTLQEPVQCESTGAPFAVDVIKRPANNPWQAQLRLSGFDFYPGGDVMAVCTWDGDVWRVSGLGQLPATSDEAVQEKIPTLTWQRIASGLFQPLGLKIVDDQIFVTCRDQLVILRDYNGDQETDFYECFNNDHQVTEHFHEFAMGLQVDEEGNFYYAKSARHALPALVPHHGTLLRISPDGSETTILANGFRAANGVCLNPDGTFIVTDQEGHWNPKNRINWVEPGGFYGNMYGYHDVTDSSNEAMEPPLCWITNAFDRSPAELLWVDSEQWGPLQGQLLNLSYGNGKIFVVPFETVDGVKQGGMSQLPIASLPTGVMRGRFHPADGQLYACGMFAWAGNQTQPGGFYRVRYTGAPVHLPVELHARQNAMELTFSGTLATDTASEADRYRVKVWDLKRTKNYGSPHLNERELEVTAVEVAPDGKTVRLEIPALEPTWCMEIRYRLRAADGTPVEGALHNTVHVEGDE